MKGSRTREPCHPSQSFGSARAKPLCAHPDRPFARRGVTSDPRVFPVLVGKNHYRPVEHPLRGRGNRFIQHVGPIDRALIVRFFCHHPLSAPTAYLFRQTIHAFPGCPGSKYVKERGARKVWVFLEKALHISAHCCPRSRIGFGKSLSQCFLCRIQFTSQPGTLCSLERHIMSWVSFEHFVKHLVCQNTISPCNRYLRPPEPEIGTVLVSVQFDSTRQVCFCLIQSSQMNQRLSTVAKEWW